MNFALLFFCESKANCKNKENQTNMELASSQFYPKKTIKHFDLLPSTNDFAMNWCQSDDLPPEGSVVITENQSNGRGQAQNKWHSEAHQNLTFSMIYYPDFLDLDHIFALNMLTSLAVLDVVLAQKIPNAFVKWPNDIIIDSQKVAGILIRNILSGKKIAASVIGIGLNVNQTIFPPELPNPTSLQLKTHQKLNKLAILNQLIQAFETRYLALQSGNYASLKANYLDHLFLLHQKHSFVRKDGVTFRGIIVDVRDSGHLLVDVDGRIQPFDFKEIGFV